MQKELIISTTPQETKLAILEDDELVEFYIAGRGRAPPTAAAAASTAPASIACSDSGSCRARSRNSGSRNPRGIA